MLVFEALKAASITYLGISPPLSSPRPLLLTGSVNFSRKPYTLTSPTDSGVLRNWVGGAGFLFVLVSIHVKVAEAACGLGARTAALEPNNRPDSI